MGRKAMIGAFLLSVSLALFFYYNHKSAEGLLDDKGEGEARLKLHEFTLYRYEGARLDSVMSGDYGKFVAPDVIDLSGRVSGSRMSDKGREDFTAERVIIKLLVNSMDDLFNRAEVEHAYLPNGLKFHSGDETLKAQRAKFFAKDKTLVGEGNVTLEGIGRSFKGYDGFRWDTKKQILQVYGKVEGELIPDAK